MSDMGAYFPALCQRRTPKGPGGRFAAHLAYHGGDHVDLAARFRRLCNETQTPIEAEIDDGPPVGGLLF
jgi:hypothetical protein